MAGDEAMDEPLKASEDASEMGPEVAEAKEAAGQVPSIQYVFAHQAN